MGREELMIRAQMQARMKKNQATFQRPGGLMPARF
jgi:hypothetical protein